MDFNEFCNNLIQLEDNAGNLYEKFAMKCDERIKEAVLGLSREEEQHKEEMLKLYNSLSNVKSELNEEVKLIIKEQREYIENKDKNLDFKNDKDFFGFAFEIEQQSVDLFSKVLEMFSEGTNEYKIISNLIEEEKRHMIYILRKIHELK